MIQIDMPMPKSCLECRFSWSGDSCTYCIAQCYHKLEGGFHLHKINHTYHGREEQEVWREPSCPLIAEKEPDNCCFSCGEGHVKGCPHADGRHYNVWGEGIEPPDYCPNHQPDNEMPF